MRYTPSMLPSELARDMMMDQAAMSKLLKRYFLESGTQREPTLSPEVVSHVREVQRLLATGAAATIPQAVQIVLGTYVAPIPTASARAVLQSLAELRTGVDEALDRLKRIEGEVVRVSEYIARVQARQAARTVSDSPDPAS